MSNISNEFDSKRAELERIFTSPKCSNILENDQDSQAHYSFQERTPSTSRRTYQSNMTSGKTRSILISLTAATLFTGAGIATSVLNAQAQDAFVTMTRTSPPAYYYYPGIWQTYSWGKQLDPHLDSTAAIVHNKLQQGTVNVPASTITGIVDNSSMSASLYWTLILKNNNQENKEAVFEIDLPKNSAVSRATLWVNGVAQEAAFASNEQVQTAYDWVVVRNRDPLLITQIAPNRIKVLASPVLANGGEMKLRIGLTAPLQLDDNGTKYLKLPKVMKSNLKFDNKQDVHITSDTKLSGLGKVEDSGFYLLRANIDQDAMKDAKIKVGGVTPHRFATRLMHTSPAEYVLAELNDGRMTLTRQKSLPDAKIITDTDIVSRVTNLWAHQEIERLVSRGETSQACELANIFRIVSSVSGAVVLEQDGDYSYSGMNRDMYRTVGATAGSGNYTGASGASAPMLQGATNGTIGPMGSDATVIMGVNTAGTVRVNNLVYLEVILNYLSFAFQFIGIALAVYLAREAACKPGVRSLERVQLGIIALLVGATGIYAPTIMSWLIQAARNANWFS